MSFAGTWAANFGKVLGIRFGGISRVYMFTEAFGWNLPIGVLECALLSKISVGFSSSHKASRRLWNHI